MAVRGIFASHSSLVGDRRTNDFGGQVLMNYLGGSAPMLALSSGMPKEPVRQVEFSWVEDSRITGNAKVSGAQSDSVTSFDVDDTNIWTPNMILLVESTGEQMFLSAITGNTITVTRGFAGTVPAAMLDQDRIQAISSAYPEASTGAEPVMQVGESRTNYVQIFKSAWAVSGTATAIDYQTGAKLAESKSQATSQLMDQVERGFMFGRPSVFTLGNRQVRTSGGIQHAISTYGGLVEAANDNATAGRLNLDTLNSFLRRIFERQVKGMPNERISYCGSAVQELIQRMVMDVGEYSITQGESVFGINVAELKTFNGSVKLMTHPMFVENDTWNHEFWVLHPGLIKRRVLRDLEVLAYKGNNQTDALDAETGHLRMEMGFEVKGTATMGMLTNIQTAGGVAALPTT